MKHVSELPETPYDEVPPCAPYKPINGVGCDIPNGSMVEVWNIQDSEDFHIRMRKPLPDGTQSVLRFGITKEAAAALTGLLINKLHPETTTLDPL